MADAGVHLSKPVRRFPDGNHLLDEEPDRVQFELFEPQLQAISPKIQHWFDVFEN